MDLESRIDEKLLETTKARLELENNLSEHPSAYQVDRLALLQGHETRLFQALANLHFALSEVEESLRVEI